jgi:acetyltransferase-like isoleucine patch superfamily enzyme
LTFNDADEVRALFSDLIGKKVDDSFLERSPNTLVGGNPAKVIRSIAD